MEQISIEILYLYLGMIVFGILVEQITLDPENNMLIGNPTSVFIGLHTQSWVIGCTALALNIAIYQYRIKLKGE